MIEDVLANLESLEGFVHHLGLDRLSVADKPVRRTGDGYVLGQNAPSPGGKEPRGERPCRLDKA